MKARTLLLSLLVCSAAIAGEAELLSGSAQIHWRQFTSTISSARRVVIFIGTPHRRDIDPKPDEEYAIQIARDWNVKPDGSGFVTRFEVDAEYAARFPKKIVGSRVHEELWVPADSSIRRSLVRSK